MSTGLRFPKPAPHLLAKRERAADLARVDRLESAKARKRSGGRCEVRTVPPSPHFQIGRCMRSASEIHHLINGSGRRNIGRSILAMHKLHVCGGPHGHHGEITGHVLRPIGSQRAGESAATVIYERVGAKP